LVNTEKLCRSQQYNAKPANVAVDSAGAQASNLGINATSVAYLSRSFVFKTFLYFALNRSHLDIDKINIITKAKIWFQEAKTEMTFLTKKLEKTIAPSGPGKVVDIKKYLAQTQDNPKIAHKNGVRIN
jgi:hypothetical protein